jgi:glucose-1-phosphate adenylyltransferase
MVATSGVRSGRPRILALILAGGAGGRLELLTANRAKPAVPYGGKYRLIDFPLSNAHNSGIEDVWLVQQFHPTSLADHLAGGRPWDLDRTVGGLLVLTPHLGSDRAGWHHGTADALWRQSPLIRNHDPDALVVVSADAVYRLDYGDVVAQHRESGASVTMVTTRVSREDARRYGVVEVDDAGTITGYAYKPDEPTSDLVTTEVFVFDPAIVLDLLHELADEAGDDPLDDLGDELLPRLVDGGKAQEYRLDEYWRDVGTVPAYLAAHLDLFDDPPGIRLDDPRWPIRTQESLRAAARCLPGAEIDDALLSPGCTVAGRVERSVLGPGVVVEAGASVREAVLFHDVVVRAGASISRAVVDADSEIGAGAQLGFGEPAADAADDVVLVAADSAVPEGARLGPGTRYPSDEDEGGERV